MRDPLRSNPGWSRRSGSYMNVPKPGPSLREHVSEVQLISNRPFLEVLRHWLRGSLEFMRAFVYLVLLNEGSSLRDSSDIQRDLD